MKLWPLCFLFLMGGCAMQRAADAETAQKIMVGMDKEQVFTCMGIPQKKASEGDTEIWAYDSGDKRSARSKQKISTSKGFADSITAGLGLEDEVRTSRFCKVQIVLRNDHVTTIHYTGPTGGFLTEDEQCAYAVRNCLKAADAK